MPSFYHDGRWFKAVVYKKRCKAGSEEEANSSSMAMAGERHLARPEPNGNPPPFPIKDAEKVPSFLSSKGQREMGGGREVVRMGGVKWQWVLFEQLVEKTLLSSVLQRKPRTV